LPSKETDILDRLRDCIVNLDISGVQKACKDALATGIKPYRAIMDGMAKGMDIVGQKYEEKSYFLAELIMAGEVMKEGMKILEPHLKSEDLKGKGRVVIGTVAGDLHDIGKNIVINLLKAAGFEVIDLGVDVSSQRFFEAVREHKPDILGMSALLTTTMKEMELVIKEIEKAGLRSKVKTIIGGAPITPEFAEKIGADAAAKDAVKGVKICKEWRGID
jgi:5-methyltetrahydrofolate--homocysteine methyltransferase